MCSWTNKLGQVIDLSPATLVQRFGTKRELLIAAAMQAKSNSSATFKSMRKVHASPLKTLVNSLSQLTAPINTVRTFVNGLAFLQMDLSVPQLHELTLEGFELMYNEIKRLLDEAVASKEIKAYDTDQLASTIQAVYHGAMITWAVYQKGSLEQWMKTQIESALVPYRVNETGV